MKIIYNNIIPFKGFNAINLFGILFARKDGEVTDRTIRHEQIHTMQQKELLWVGFYVWYMVEWLIRVLFTEDRFSKMAYFNISFEREAYMYQNVEKYAEYREHYRWIKLIKL